MHINRLAASDAPRYRSLMLHAYEAAADAFTSTPDERAAERESWWVKRIADPKGLSVSFGAFNSEELVGTVTVEFSSRPKTRHKALIIGMFVLESARWPSSSRCSTCAGRSLMCLLPDCLPLVAALPRRFLPNFATIRSSRHSRPPRRRSKRTWLVSTWFWTGLRTSEIAGLRW